MSVLPQNDISTGTAIVVFFQFFGGALFLGIGETVFVSRLVREIIDKAPGVDPAAIVAAGAEGVRKVVSGANLIAVLEAYNSAITIVFVSRFSKKEFSGSCSSWTVC